MTAPHRQDDGLLTCPLCHSINIAEGVCYIEDSPKEPAVRCVDCGCRATLKAWNTRATPASRDGAEGTGDQPFAWTIPGDDQADCNGFIPTKISREGEFTKPLYATPPKPAPDFCATADAICHYPACSCARIENPPAPAHVRMK